MPINSVLIAIPAYGGSIKNACVDSLIRLARHFSAKNVDAEFEIADGGGIDLTRNYFGTKVHRTTQITHLLFVDSDSAFQPETVIRLLEANRPIVGCVYRKRSEPPSYVVTPLNAKMEVNEEGLCRVAGIGLGLALIQRAVFDRLATETTLRSFTDHPYRKRANYPLLGFFDHPLSGTHISEDTAFCHRWRAIGGDVWAKVNEDIGHVGDFEFRGSYLEFLKAKQKHS